MIFYRLIVAVAICHHCFPFDSEFGVFDCGMSLFQDIPVRGQSGITEQVWECASLL